MSDNLADRRLIKIPAATGKSCPRVESDRLFERVQTLEDQVDPAWLRI